MLKAIHAQEDRAAAQAKARDVVAKLRAARMRKAAELVEQGVAETLSYYAFPEPHWRRIRNNNPLERIVREIQRRTRIVGAFPDGESALNLAAARLRHIAGTQWSTRRYLDLQPLHRGEAEDRLTTGTPPQPMCARLDTTGPRAPGKTASSRAAISAKLGTRRVTPFSTSPSADLMSPMRNRGPQPAGMIEVEVDGVFRPTQQILYDEWLVRAKVHEPGRRGDDADILPRAAMPRLDDDRPCPSLGFGDDIGGRCGSRHRNAVLGEKERRVQLVARDHDELRRTYPRSRCQGPESARARHSEPPARYRWSATEDRRHAGRTARAAYRRNPVRRRAAQEWPYRRLDRRRSTPAPNRWRGSRGQGQVPPPPSGSIGGVPPAGPRKRSEGAGAGSWPDDVLIVAHKG